LYEDREIEIGKLKYPESSAWKPPGYYDYSNVMMRNKRKQNSRVLTGDCPCGCGKVLARDCVCG